MRYLLPLLFLFCTVPVVSAQADLSTLLSEQMPSHVQSIEVENTAEHEENDDLTVEATGLVAEWIGKSDIEITNPYLIEQLNKTDVSRSIFAFGYSSEVYLGRWPLSYQTTGTSINWNYQKINDNFIAEGQLTYLQNDQQQVSGGLQSKVAKSEHVQTMMLMDTSGRINWPIGLHSVIGARTEKELTLSNDTSANHLETYVGAVKETGTITYGEVYLTMTGRKQEITIKNVVEEEVIAWLPIQDHLAFHFK